MPAPTLAELSREVPRKKWYEGLDRSILVAAVCSFLFHYTLMTYIQSLPIPRTPFQLQTQEMPVPPPVVYKIPVDEPLTPPPVKLRNGKSDGAKPGTGDGAMKAKKRGLIGALERNPGLLAMIVKESEIGADIQGVTALPDKFRSLHSGVRIAQRNDAPSTTDFDNGVQIAVNLTEFGREGTVDIAKRATRKVQAQIKRTRPIFSTTDAQANRLVRQALQSRLGAVKHCYERALKLNPTLAGKISVQVMFAVDGTVSGASVVTNTVDADVGVCVAQALRRTRTTQPLSEPSTVQVPYIFTPRE